MKLKKQNTTSGFTMIEMMVALAIGSFITLAAFSLFIASKQVSQIQEMSADMKNDADTALRFMTQDIKLAGFSKVMKSDFDKEPFDWTATTEGGNASVSDTITVLYDAWDSGVNVDCGGIMWPVGYVIRNTYAVVDRVLTCNGIELASNVESLQILYGLDTDSVVGPNWYVETDLAQTHFTTQNYKPVVVRIGLLIGSPVGSGTPFVKNVKVLDEEALSLDDNKLYYLVERTIVLKNML
jgi:type IV pilus assembly protein PilW